MVFDDVFGDSQNATFTSSPTNSSDADRHYVQTVVDVTKITVTIMGVLILVIGLPGNIITILIVKSKPVMNKRIRTTLIWLSFFNLWLLVLTVPRRVLRAQINWHVWEVSELFCVAYRILALTVMGMVTGLLPLVNLLRLIRARSCWDKITPGVIHCIVFFMFLLHILQHAVYLKLDVDHPNIERFYCHSNKTEIWAFTTLSNRILNATITFYAPGFVIIMCNGIICWRLRNKELPDTSMAKKRMSPRCLGFTIFVAHIFYVGITFFPIGFFYTSEHSGLNKYGNLHEALDYLAREIFFMLFYSNSALSFMICCFFGRRFRMEFNSYIHKMGLPVTITIDNPFVSENTHIFSRSLTKNRPNSKVKDKDPKTMMKKEPNNVVSSVSSENEVEMLFFRKKELVWIDQESTKKTTGSSRFSVTHLDTRL